MSDELTDTIMHSNNCLHELVENYGNGNMEQNAVIIKQQAVIMEQNAVIIKQQAVIIKHNSVKQSTEMSCVNINVKPVIASCNRRVWRSFSPVPLDLDDVFVNGEWKKLPEKSDVIYVSDDDIPLGELKTKKARTSKSKVTKRLPEKSEVVYDDADDDIPLGELKARTSKRAICWDDLHRIGLPDTYKSAEGGSLWDKISRSQHRKNCLKKYNS